MPNEDASKTASASRTADLAKRRLSAHGYAPPDLAGFALFLVKAQFAFKLVSSLLCVALSSITVLILLPFFLITGCGGYINYFAGRLLSLSVGLFGGIRYKIIGQEHIDASRPCVFVSNHQSSLDMITMGRVFPKDCVVIGKKEVAKMPFIGWYFVAAGNFALDRKNHSKAMDTMGQVAARMVKDKVGLWIFPEGTRSYMRTPDLLDFKKGGFRTAIDCQCPIVPVVQSVYTHVFDEKAGRWPGGTITIRILPPIETKGLTPDDTQKLLDKTRAEMLQTLKQISGPRYRDTITELDVVEEEEEEVVEEKKEQ